MKALPIRLKLLGAALLLGLSMLTACDKKSEENATPVKVTITASTPSVLGDAQLVDLNGSLAKEGETVECTADGNVLTAEVLPGRWELSVTARYKELGKSGTVSANYTGPISVAREALNGRAYNVQLLYTPSNFRDGFVIAEIFASGTTKPDKKQYNEDKYLIIANASADKTLYLDGYLLLQSEFLSSLKKKCSPEVPLESSMVVKTIYQFPGGGTDYPVQPGEQIVVCQSAIDHREANALSMDLSNAKFEWLDDNALHALKDPVPNNPAVSNMKHIFTKQLPGKSGRTYWMMNNQESETFAIGKFKGVTPEEYLADSKNFFNYTWEFKGKTMGADDPKPLLFPNEWVEDAVSLGIAGHTGWSVVSPQLDAGFISASTSKKDMNRYFKSVQRKRNADGSWVDTNNSTNDFEVKRASLLPPAE